jgi:arginine decarboxylase
MGPVPKGVFLTKGVGRHRERLTSFELALRSAGIAEFNLVRVKSIFPPNCKMLPQQEGLRYLSPGQIVFNSATYGYLSEHHSFGETDEKAGDYAEDLAASMLGTILGVEFDPNISYDERKDIWRLSDKIVSTRNITQSAVGDREGLWTSVVAAAVFVTF